MSVCVSVLGVCGVAHMCERSLERRHVEHCRPSIDTGVYPKSNGL